jgi:hypothetical protein
MHVIDGIKQNPIIASVDHFNLKYLMMWLWQNLKKIKNNLFEDRFRVD